MLTTAPAWDFRRTTLAAREHSAYGVSQGLTAEQCLAGSGLSPADLADTQLMIDAGQELTVTRNLLRLLGDRPGLGVEVGRRFTLSSFGLLGFVMMTSPTVREATTTGLRFVQLSNAFVTPRWQETDDESRLTFDDSEIPLDVREFMLSRDLICILGIVETFLGSLPADLPGVAVELGLSPDRGAPLAAELHPFPVRFDAPASVLRLPLELLDLPLPQANAATAAMCEQQCLDLLETRAQRSGLAGQVRERILRLPGEFPTAATVAGELHVDRRTLTRRLAAEGTSYRALVEEVRRTLAVELLEAGFGVEQIARRLGYAETSGLTHAFTRWYGVPPRAYPSYFREHLA